MLSRRVKVTAVKFGAMVSWLPVFMVSFGTVFSMALGAALWISGALLDVDSWLVTFMSRFENYGADKFVLALGIAGGMSFIYSVLRIADLRKEMQLRDAAQARADWTATHDHLTKLPNRYAFERKILPKLSDTQGNIPEESSSNVTIFSVDLDGFKKVNDLVGHKGGDVLLVEVSKRICALGNADCVYRFGGDEFIIIALGLTAAREEWFAKVLIQAVTRPILIDGFAVEVGASVGYDRWNEGAEPLEDAAHRADLAMGFSTLDGIPMATRPGWLDPGVILHLLQQKKLSADQVEDMLYHRAGLLGVSGINADTRDLLEDGRPEAREALDLFTLRIAGEIGRMGDPF